jgi:hypothetical protein
MEAPMGPTPYWMARIFFFTTFSVSSCSAGHSLRICPEKETSRIEEFGRAFNAIRENKKKRTGLKTGHYNGEEPGWLPTGRIVAGAGVAPHNVSSRVRQSKELVSCPQKN